MIIIFVFLNFLSTHDLRFSWIEDCEEEPLHKIEMVKPF